MKTIIDAVNEFKGEKYLDSELGYNYNQFIEAKIDFNEFTKGQLTVGNGVRGGGGYWGVVCTTSEFNAMIAEMSEGFEEYKREYEMNKVETMDGMVYEIGAVYEFYFDDIGWSPDVLKGISLNSTHPFCCESDSCSQEARVLCRPLGVITPAPVELVDGKAYMLDFRNERFVGLYNKKTKRFVFSATSSYVMASSATNIIPLVPEVK